MASISLASAVHVFPCPNCGETINTSMQQCAFCGAPIDHAAAEQAAAETSRISSAVSDASYIRVMLGLLVPFFFLMFFPFLTLLGVVGFWVLKIAIPLMAVRWWIRYSSIKTTDADFPKARKTVVIVSAIWLVAFLLTLPFHR